MFLIKSKYEMESEISCRHNMEFEISCKHCSAFKLISLSTMCIKVQRCLYYFICILIKYCGNVSNAFSKEKLDIHGHSLICNIFVFCNIIYHICKMLLLCLNCSIIYSHTPCLKCSVVADMIAFTIEWSSQTQT